MKKIKILSTTLTSLLAISCTYAEGMCNTRETVIFNCELQKSISSLCESEDTGVLSYRNGSAKKINLEVSDNAPLKGKIFYFSNTPYAGGGEAHIRFSRNDYTYYIYDKTIKTDDGPTFSAGIAVFKDQRKISDLGRVNTTI